MKNYFVVFFLFLVPAFLFAQEKEYYSFEVDIAPTPTNFAEMRSSIVYPDSAKNNNIEGAVVVQVLVNETGDIREIGKYSGDSVFYNVVLDAVSILKFKPAKHKGQTVRCWMNIPFKFALGNKNRSEESENNESK